MLRRVDCGRTVRMNRCCIVDKVILMTSIQLRLITLYPSEALSASSLGCGYDCCCGYGQGLGGLRSLARESVPIHRSVPTGSSMSHHVYDMAYQLVQTGCSLSQ